MNLGARYHLNTWLQLIAQFNNLFDRRYYTAAQLGQWASRTTGTSSPGRFPPSASFPSPSTFYAPGAPTQDVDRRARNVLTNATDDTGRSADRRASRGWSKAVEIARKSPREVYGFFLAILSSSTRGPRATRQRIATRIRVG